MTTTTTQPLPRGQQLLLQKMMAHHGYTNHEAQKVFHDLMKEEDGDEGGDGNTVSSFMGNATTVEEAFCSINEQLKPGFGLEIISMVDSSQSIDPSTKKKNKKIKPMKYHCIVNCSIDSISQSSFGALNTGFTDHDRAYIRVAFQRFVEEDSKSMKRSTLINLRGELPKGYNLPLPQTERLVQIFLEQKWLRLSTHQHDSDDDDEEEEEEEEDDADDDDEEEEEDEETDNDEGEDNDDDKKKKKRKKKTKPTRRSKKKSHHQHQRRHSVQNKIELAPRTYLELSHFLTDHGLDPQDMPQFVFHRNNEDE
jgi:hypothetical protein